MSVLKYVNGAWQETSETPKKYVSSAWEDSDGYAYENGAWTEKWSAIPENYLIWNGKINPKFTTQTFSNSSSLGSGGYQWRYDSSKQALACALRPTSTTDITQVYSSLTIGGGELVLPFRYRNTSMSYTNLYLEASTTYGTFENTSTFHRIGGTIGYHGASTSQGTANARTNDDVAILPSDSKKTLSANVKGGLWSSDSSMTITSVTIDHRWKAKQSSSISACTAYIYNMWVETTQ